MDMVEIAGLRDAVLGAAFVLSMAFGAISRKTDFCTMGAISDVVNLGDWTRMRQWGLAAGVAMCGFALLAGTGQINPARTLYAGSRWLYLSASAGGFCFGIGMVLASGCAGKTLVRVGGGSLKSLVVLVMTAVSAIAALKGVSAVIRIQFLDAHSAAVPGAGSLPAWLAAQTGWPQAGTQLVAGLLLGLALMLWALSGKGFLTLNNLWAGLGIGALVVAMWWVSGSLGHVSEHPETLEEAFLATRSGRAEALSFVAPSAYLLEWMLFYTDAFNVLTLSVVSVLGVVLGSSLVALAGRSFRWEGFRDTEDLALHLAGGLLMGTGGITAMGCSIGQGLSGISTLALTSFVAVAAIMVGAWAGFRFLVWRVERNA